MSDVIYDVINPKCPTQQVLELVVSKWTMLVILALGDGPLRYPALQRRVTSSRPRDRASPRRFRRFGDGRTTTSRTSVRHAAHSPQLHDTYFETSDRFWVLEQAS
jgi:hypothetical protein